MVIGGPDTSVFPDSGAETALFPGLAEQTAILAVGGTDGRIPGWWSRCPYCQGWADRRLVLQQVTAGRLQTGWPASGALAEENLGVLAEVGG